MKGMTVIFKKGVSSLKKFFFSLVGEWVGFYSEFIKPKFIDVLLLLFKVFWSEWIQFTNYFWDYLNGAKEKVSVGETLTLNERLKISQFIIKVGYLTLVLTLCYYYYMFVTIKALPFFSYTKLVHLIGKWTYLFMSCWFSKVPGVEYYGESDSKSYWSNFYYSAYRDLVKGFKECSFGFSAWCWSSTYLLLYIYLFSPCWLSVYFMILEGCKSMVENVSVTHMKVPLVNLEFEFPFTWISKYKSVFVVFYFSVWSVNTFYKCWKDNSKKFKYWYLGDKKFFYGNKCEIYFYDKLNVLFGAVWVIWTYISVMYYFGFTLIYGFCMFFDVVFELVGATEEQFGLTKTKYAASLDDNLFNDFPFLTSMLWGDWFIIKFIICLVYFFIYVEVNISAVINLAGLSQTFEEEVLEGGLSETDLPVFDVEAELTFEESSKWTLSLYIKFMGFVKSICKDISGYYSECFSKDIFMTLLNFDPVEHNHFFTFFFSTLYTYGESDLYLSFKHLTFFVYVFYTYREKAWKPTGEDAFAMYSEFTMLIPNFLFLGAFKYGMGVPLYIFLQFSIPAVLFSLFAVVKVAVMLFCNLFVGVLFMVCFSVWLMSLILSITGTNTCGFEKTCLPFMSMWTLNLDFLFQKDVSSAWGMVLWCLKSSILGSWVNELEFKFKYLSNMENSLEGLKVESSEKHWDSSVMGFYKFLWDNVSKMPVLGVVMHKCVILFGEFMFGTEFHSEGFKLIANNKSPGSKLDSEDLSLSMTHYSMEEVPNTLLYSDFIFLIKSITFSNKSLEFNYIFFFLSSLFPFSKPKEIFSSAVSSVLLFKILNMAGKGQEMEKNGGKYVRFFFYELSYCFFGPNKYKYWDLGVSKELDKLYLKGEKDFNYDVGEYFNSSEMHFGKGGLLSFLLSHFSPESSFHIKYNSNMLLSEDLDHILDFIMDNSFEENIFSNSGLKALEETCWVEGFLWFPFKVYLGISCKDFFFQNTEILHESLFKMSHCMKNQSWSHMNMNVDVELYVEDYLGSYEKVCKVSDKTMGTYQEVLGSVGIKFYSYSGEYIISFDKGFKILEGYGVESVESKASKEEQKELSECIQLVFVKDASCSFTLDKVVKEGVVLEYVLCSKSKFNSVAKSRPMGGSYMAKHMPLSAFTFISKSSSKKM